ncbi:hypothetical protein HK099_004565 [Clydaea vesicula]|uniref:GH16 domain-containing protein n=1 Tax=Clydaea vesicula TaxID=447962 RepID=A0AAD5XVI8_9FUNG|nr:hypothetical protein HK099_004565 [Clydaea vesicula]KAJ3382207.1 hypothetical protein HDU92_004891 [Lobulomyces angularis]
MHLKTVIFTVVSALTCSSAVVPETETIQEIYDRVTSRPNTNATLHRRGCYERWMDFSNRATHSGFDLQTTGANQNPNGDGWWMHSRSAGTGGNTWSRLRFSDYTFNGHPNAKTHISVVMRGAPDGGKNSNAYLIQTNGKYDLGAAVQDGTKDEIDFSEYYGGSKKATSCLYKSGRTVSGFPKTYPVSDAGNRFYKYEMVLDNAARDLHLFLSVDGQPLNEHIHVQGNSVPDKPMELFAGIWDCSGNNWCPGVFNGDAGMVIKSIWVQGC